MSNSPSSAQLRKAVILCAGEGTRLRPLTYARPKALLPVAGRHFLDWVLRELSAIGIQAVCIVVSPRCRQPIADFASGGKPWRLTVEFALQDPPLGLAHATAMAREFVADDPFLLYLGDNLVEGGLAPFVAAFAAGNCAASIIVKSVPNPCDYGVVVTDGEQIVRLVEKPSVPPSSLAITGIYAFTPCIFDAIEAIEPSARGEYEITDAIQYVVDHFGPVSAFTVSGYWVDAGRPATFLEANHYLLQALPASRQGAVDAQTTITGAVTVSEGATVTTSRLVGPAWIGEGAVVENATVGPNVSLGPGCRVKQARLQDAVILENTTISGLHIQDALVGADCLLCGPQGTVLAELLIADCSVVKFR